MKIEQILKKQKLYYKDLSDYGEKNKSSKELKLKQCNNCGFCCYNMPCDLAVEDIPIIAKHLNITSKELFNTYLCMMDYRDGNFTLTPIKKGQNHLAGKLKPLEDCFHIGFCIFYNGKCTIEECKPKGGKIYNCWDNKSKKDCFISFTKEELKSIAKNLK